MLLNFMKVRLLDQEAGKELGNLVTGYSKDYQVGRMLIFKEIRLNNSICRSTRKDSNNNKTSDFEKSDQILDLGSDSISYWISRSVSE